MLDVGNSYGYEVLLPLLESWLEGSRRKITLRSIHALIEQRLAAKANAPRAIRPGRPRKTRPAA
jgi:hypothetical protein